jgi:hypothetical protein
MRVSEGARKLLASRLDQAITFDLVIRVKFLLDSKREKTRVMFGKQLIKFHFILQFHFISPF